MLESMILLLVYVAAVWAAVVYLRRRAAKAERAASDTAKRVSPDGAGGPGGVDL